MCGRYASSRNPDELVEEFEIEQNHAAGVVAGFNVAPTAVAPVVLTRAPRGESASEPARQLRPLVWGLVPSWAKDRKAGARMINARVEAVFEKPAFRRPVLVRRCLVPTDGWYEWQRGADPGTGKPRKQPYFTRRSDGASAALGGLYEFWRDPSVTDRDDPSAWVVSFTILTRPAEPGLDAIHDRMPLVLERSAWADWLSPGVTDRAPVEALLRQAQAEPPGRFESHPVSDAVNDVRHDGPELVRPQE